MCEILLETRRETANDRNETEWEVQNRNKRSSHGRHICAERGHPIDVDWAKQKLSTLVMMNIFQCHFISIFFHFVFRCLFFFYSAPFVSSERRRATSSDQRRTHIIFVFLFRVVAITARFRLSESRSIFTSMNMCAVSVCLMVNSFRWPDIFFSRHEFRLLFPSSHSSAVRESVHGCVRDCR